MLLFVVGCITRATCPGFLSDVKNMMGVIDAAIPIVRILLKAEVCVLGTAIRRKHAKLKDVLSSVL